MTDSTAEIPDSPKEIENGPESHPTQEEIQADNLNLALARAIGLDPRLIKQPGFTITTEGSGMVEVTWESIALMPLDAFMEIVNSVQTPPKTLA